MGNSWINVTQGKKFDDPNVAVDQSFGKLNDFDWLAMRRALQAITNCVLQGTAGTGAFVTAGCTGGASSGVKIANPVDVKIDGIKYTIASQDNIPVAPAGTQGTNTVAKYLIYAGTDGSAYCTQGNIVDKGDSIKAYASAAAAALDAKLPTLPKNAVALGYCQIQAPAAVAVAYQVGTLSTAGTISYVDLISMPMDT